MLPSAALVEFAAQSAPPTVAQVPRIPLESFRVSVVAIPAAPKSMLAPALRVIAFICRTAPPGVPVSLEKVPAARVVEATTSACVPPASSSVPPARVSAEVSASLVVSLPLA